MASDAVIRATRDAQDAGDRVLEALRLGDRELVILALTTMEALARKARQALEEQR